MQLLMPIKKVNKTAHELRAIKKSYHNMEIWEKDQKENSHKKVSQSLILLRTHIHIHSSRHIPRSHGFLLFCTVVIKKLQQS